MKALWKNKVIAESNDIVVVESRNYFPEESVKMEFLQRSGRTYQCSWKGLADYYNVVVDGEVNEDAAFVYPSPTDAAKQIKERFSFWKGIELVE
jgi:uncharacterized protein (DUF427 family)